MDRMLIVGVNEMARFLGMTPASLLRRGELPSLISCRIARSESGCRQPRRRGMRSTRAAPNMGSGGAVDARRNRQRKSSLTRQNPAHEVVGGSHKQLSTNHTCEENTHGRVF